MGTRGAFGLYREGKTKATYNHYDSYPSGLGEDIIRSIAKSSIESLNNAFDNIILVKNDSTPTEEQIEECVKIVKSDGEKDWYWLLRDAQGDLDAYVVKGLKYMIDGQDFLKDSLFCEWAYIINLDENILEVYEGFQKESEHNRYYDESLEKDDYKNCKLLATIHLHEIFGLEEERIPALLKRELGSKNY